MKYNTILIAAFMWLTLSTSAIAAEFSKDYFYNVDVVSVYDGDTFTVTSEVWPSITVQTNIRLFGIDTPEQSWRAKCEKEQVLAVAARDFLVNALESAKSTEQQIYVTGIKKDKYAGRHVARLMIGTVDVGKAMINAGHAVEYFGRGTKKDWCL